MRKIHIVLLALLITTISFAEAINLDSRVTSATVFTSRAMVQREAQINLPAGRSQLCFSNLTPDFLDESVRISGQGTVEVKILDVKVETEYTAEIQQQETRRLQQKLDSLQWTSQAHNDQLAVLNTKKEFLESLKAEAPKENNRAILTGKLSIQEWQTMLTFLENNLGDLYKDQRIIGKKQALLQNEIKALQKKIDESRNSGQRRYKKILVTVETEKTGRLTLNATYITQNVGWYPLYDARVSSEDKAMQLFYYGMIRQNTGEDWKNINLVLSTANPVAFTNIPDLDPWFIDFLRAARQKGSGYTEVHLNELSPPPPAEDNDVVMAERAIKAMPAAPPQAIVRTGQLAAVFDIPVNSDIPGDNVYHKVTIGVLPLVAQFEYAVVAKQVDKAFLTGKVVNTSEYPLLPGEVSVFFANDFVNKSSVNTVVPTDTFRLALGVDDAIKVERKLVNRFR